MKSKLAVLLTSLSTAGLVFGQQALVCPPAGSGATECEAYHYHVQVFRPQPRGFVDATATERFATQAACDKVRQAHIARNLAIVQYFKKTKNEQNYEADRFGPCHCDMTQEKTNPAFLNETQRRAQIGAVEDARLRVREKLLKSGLTTGDELVRSLLVTPETSPMLGAAKVVVVPQTHTVAGRTNSADDLRSTDALDSVKPAVAALDLPLAEVEAGAASYTEMASAAAEATGAPAEGDGTAEAADAAAVFVEQETERIQSLLTAASEVTDESLKNRIVEATIQRTQVLSNLRTLIEGSGVRSRLAMAAREADSEEGRLALVRALFGDTVAPHWSAKDPAGVIVPSDRDIDSEPERVLRDSGGRYSEQQKKRALYTLLSRSLPSAEQQLWLITLVDQFLR